VVVVVGGVVMAVWGVVVGRMPYKSTGTRSVGGGTKACHRWCSSAIQACLGGQSIGRPAESHTKEGADGKKSITYMRGIGVLL
jgi:hypothetical protein